MSITQALFARSRKIVLHKTERYDTILENYFMGKELVTIIEEKSDFTRRRIYGLARNPTPEEAVAISEWAIRITKEAGLKCGDGEHFTQEEEKMDARLVIHAFDHGIGVEFAGRGIVSESLAYVPRRDGQSRAFENWIDNPNGKITRKRVQKVVDELNSLSS